MAEEREDYYNQVKEAAKPKQSATQTISIRVPIWLKAEVLNQANEAEISPNEWVGTTLYEVLYLRRGRKEEKALEEELEQTKRDLQEANRKVETWEKAYKELEEQYNKLEKEKKQSAKASSTANKQLQELKQRPTQNQYQLKEKESARKSEAGKREQLEQRIKEANEWAERTPFIERRF
jgi:chromosome segregation ATPase